MATWRQKRQRTITAGIVVLVLLVLGYATYQLFFTTEPTCFDGVQNGDERGIDCGGSCLQVCQSDTRNLVIEWARTTPVAGDVYNMVAYVENQNRDSGIGEIAYTFRVYDDNNIIIAERSGTTFIQPNERAVIFEPSITTGNRIPYETFFEFTSIPTWVTTSERYARRVITIGEQTLENVETRPRLEATIRNTTLQPVYDIETVAIVYDQEGIARATSATTIEAIAGSDTATALFTWPQPFTFSVARVEIIPKINVFSTRNWQSQQ